VQKGEWGAQNESLAEETTVTEGKFFPEQAGKSA
jgi:hypothetical protein